MNNTIKRAFALVKKPKMELTIRTPYKTLIADYSGFSRVVTRTNEAALIVQNRMPAALHILPPGSLKVRLDAGAPADFSGDLMHLGGWLAIHPDNTCEINLVEAVDKKDLQIDRLGKADLSKVDDLNAQRFVEKIRSAAQKNFTKTSI